MRTARGSCGWCGAELEPVPLEGFETVKRELRKDARYCSKKCRQSAFRLRRRRVADGVAAKPMAFVYADPPYPGTAKKYYGDEPTYAGEVDHVKLIRELEGRRATSSPTEKIDGWALSTSVRALRDLLPLAPVGARVCAWVKPHGVSSQTFGLHNAWEPLIVVGGRRRRGGIRDWLRAMPARFGGELPGRKPIAFCAWLFDCLGMVQGDSFEDLFPGSGIVSRAWAEIASRKYSRDASPRSRADASLVDEGDASPMEDVDPSVDPAEPVQGTTAAPGVAADEVGQESARRAPTRGEGAEPLRGLE